MAYNEVEQNSDGSLTILAPMRACSVAYILERDEREVELSRVIDRLKIKAGVP